MWVQRSDPLCILKAMPLRYEIDRLGWFEFESLTQSLLKQKFGMGIEAWGGSSDLGRDAYFEGHLRYPSTDIHDGPFIFQCKFVENANAAGSVPDKPLTAAVKKECARIRIRLNSSGTQGGIPIAPEWSIRPKHYALLTNAVVNSTLRAKLQSLVKTVLPDSAIHVHDGEDICGWLDTTPKLARRFPQLLGLRDLETLLRVFLNRGVSARSESAIACAKDVANVFVPTAAYSRALQVLGSKHFVVLEGPPEMGKSAIGRMIGLGQLARGWEAIEIKYPSEFLDNHEKDVPQVFIADDFFGRTEYDPKRISTWEQELPYILPMLDKRHWLVLTTRAHLLNMARRSLDVAGANGIFPDMGEVVVDAGQLTPIEKARILYRHAKKAELDNGAVAILKKHSRSIVFNHHFTPERIRRLVTETIPSLTSLDATQVYGTIRENLANPTKGMGISFDKLLPAHRWLLYALIEHENTSWHMWFSDSQSLMKRYERLCPSPHRIPFEVVLAEMTEAFIKVLETDTEVKVDWIHPSCRDLAIDKLSANNQDRKHFLRNTTVNGLVLALSIGGGPTGVRSFPLTRDDEDWGFTAELMVRCLAANISVAKELLAAHDSAMTEELDEAMLSKFRSTLLHPALLNAAEVPEAFNGFTADDVRQLLDAYAACGLPLPTQRLLDHYQQKLEEIPASDDLYWDHATEPVQMIELTQILADSPVGDAREFLQMRQHAMQKIEGVLESWADNQVQVLPVDHTDFSSAISGCRLVEEAISALAPYHEDAVIADKFVVRLAKVQLVRTRLAAEAEEDDDDDETPQEAPSAVDIEAIFSDL